MGKGDTYRPMDRVKYDRNYSKIFSKCPIHPKYNRQQPPTSDCLVCRRLWREMQQRNTHDATD